MGWKDVLRPIRDGLRDNLPARPPKDEDAERRRKERENDARKGFTYFDTFDELDQWAADKVDPIAVANTPLICRSDPSINSQKLILIHDQAGNYHDHEAAQGATVSKESYSCKYMQYVDQFVYFSHKLVCVPPPTWTNSLHRNGIKVLGTFLLEPQTPGIRRILEEDRASSMNSTNRLAARLGEIARAHGFDGWLLNIEKTFPLRDWSRDRLTHFISQLRHQVGDDNVIWYDSLTVHNTINYQNGLTSANLPWTEAAGNLLTNYDWAEQQLDQSYRLAEIHHIPRRNIVFGIDLWAQNEGSREAGRKTYGGGGTAAGAAVVKAAQKGFSTALFGPAWPFEHFPEHAEFVERAMWDGDPLPVTLSCSCHDAKTQHANPAPWTISHGKVPRLHGTSAFFSTSFERPFQWTARSHEGSTVTAHLGRQSILPHLLSAEKIAQIKPELQGKAILYGEIRDNPSRLSILAKDVNLSTLTSSRIPHVRQSSQTSRKLAVFNLRMSGTLDVALTYRKPGTPAGMSLCIVFRTTDVGQWEVKVHPDAQETTTKHLTLDCREKEMTGIEIWMEDFPSDLEDSGPVTLLDILGISVKHKGLGYGQCSISDIGLISRAQDDVRLAWNFDSKTTEGQETTKLGLSAASPAYELPYSSTTGPFAFFLLYLDGDLLGRAYALHFVLDKETAHRLRTNKRIEIQIVGTEFDGTTLCGYSCKSADLCLEDAEDGWLVLDNSSNIRSSTST